MKLRSIARKLLRRVNSGGASPASPLAAALASGQQDWVHLYFKLRVEQAVRE